jgi:acyl carrier protein
VNVLWDEQFESLLRGALRFLPADEPLSPDLSTADAGLDSLSIVELLLAIEEAYDISVPDELLSSDTFATPTVLWNTISGLRDLDDAR